MSGMSANKTLEICLSRIGICLCSQKIGFINLITDKKQSMMLFKEHVISKQKLQAQA
jgi:hypothetical protein